MVAKVAVIYRKEDGKIVRVTTLTPLTERTITEEDMAIFMPGIKLDSFAMVLIQGKQYLDIERYRVNVSADGEYLGIIEDEDIEIMSAIDSSAEITDGLLDREASIVISVLSVIDDQARLLKYKEIEIKGKNRTEILNFFKQRGL